MINISGKNLYFTFRKYLTVFTNNFLNTYILWPKGFTFENLADVNKCPKHLDVFIAALFLMQKRFTGE